MAYNAQHESGCKMTISSGSGESAQGAENRASRIKGTHFQKQQSPSQTAKLCRESQSDTETVTLRSERGGWKRVIARWYLAGRLLNFLRYVAYFYRFYVLYAMYHPLLCEAEA